MSVHRQTGIIRRQPVGTATRFALVVVAVLFMAACSMIPREPFTQTEQANATVPGFPGVRYWADAPADELRQAIDKVHFGDEVRTTGRFSLLALSGGAYDGAFGAGVLAGWTQSGARPRFTVVTGVSAGALAAPLAFLGPAYDARLTEAFTNGMSQILGEGGLFSLLGSADMRRGTLVSIIERFVDRQLLASIAREHARGRRLLVITTNLDAQRTVIWDMGAIASSPHPDARKLFIDVLAASASVPGVFAPTAIEVEASGRRFREIHVDGGAATQVFIFPEAFLATGAQTRRPPTASSVHVIVNNTLTPQFEVVSGGTLPVIGRSFSTVIKTHARFTLFSSLEFARRNGIDFNLTYIDDSFDPPVKPGFSAEYMQAVYTHGYQKALSRQLWQKTVPLPSMSPRSPALAVR